MSDPSQNSPAPRRDKFAALASRTAETPVTPIPVVNPEPATTDLPAPTIAASPAPRRDKFAALASRTAETPVTPIPVVNPESATTDPPAPTIAASAAPRPDKLSALASRNAAAATDADSTAPSSTPGSVPTPATAAPAPRRDKLSTLASRQQASDVAPSGGRGNKFAGAARGNKLAALAAANNAASTVDTAVASNASSVQEERMKNIQERLTQRQEILNNLDRAEEMTVKLLELAHKTTTALQDLNTSPAISDLSKAYRDTLQKLHPLLSTNTQSLIHPYQNHSFESTNSMYAARVEMRLAQEHSQVLKTFGELERSKRAKQEDDVNENNKRPRENEASPIS